MAEPDYTAAETVENARRELAEYFKTFPFFKLMGIELLDIEPGRATLGMSWRPDLCQPAALGLRFQILGRQQNRMRECSVDQ